MKLERIKGILLQEYYITIHSVEVILDLFYFSIVTVVLYGFFTVFLTGKVNSAAAHYLILGMLLWEIIRVSQYTISVGALWNIWSRNLSNMFVAPLSLKEYIVAEMAAGIIKTLVTFTIISIIAAFLFNFNVLSVGILNLFIFYVNLTLFAWSLGVVLLGVIFRFGTRIQALAWGLVFLFQPLTAAFFPVKILPPFIQTISYLLPATYVFEAGRASLTNPAVNWQQMGFAFVLNIFYLTISLWAFVKMYNKSRDTGQFAKNEG